jgi:Zn-dependent M28 family amino/carboxypeptidase
MVRHFSRQTKCDANTIISYDEAYKLSIYKKFIFKDILISNLNTSDYIYIIGSNMLSDDLHAANEQANNTFTQLQLDYRFNSTTDPNQFYYRSDHYNFAKNNIPSIFYFSGVHADYHQPTDDVEKINFNKVEKVTKLVFHTAWMLANNPTRPVVNH